jgi:hypothetical protein
LSYCRIFTVTQALNTCQSFKSDVLPVQKQSKVIIAAYSSIRAMFALSGIPALECADDLAAVTLAAGDTAECAVANVLSAERLDNMKQLAMVYSRAKCRLTDDVAGSEVGVCLNIVDEGAVDRLDSLVVEFAVNNMTTNQKADDDEKQQEEEELVGEVEEQGVTFVERSLLEVAL